MYRMIGLIRIPITAAGAGMGFTAYMNYKFEESIPSFVKDMYKRIKDLELPEIDFKQIEDKEEPKLTSPSTTPNPILRQMMTESISDAVKHMQQEGGENHLMGLTRKLIEIKSLLSKVSTGEDIRMPSIVVLGSQSSGKSSVLEAIVGHEFLPKGKNMVTRRPIELTLINQEGEEYCEFPELKLGRIKSYDKVQKTLFDLNMAVPEEDCVSDQPIQLKIYSPTVPDLTMVDLPGYIQVVNKNQPKMLKQKIRELCEKYIQEPNIILAVCAADVDLANSEALRSSLRVDPLGLRTIGVVTKMDLVEPSVGESILNTTDYPLSLGYIGVVNKPSADNAAMIRSETSFFKQNNYDLSQVGSGNLRKKLMLVLETHMSRSLEHITDSVGMELEDARYEFKVQFNDRRISAESYVADCMDALKQRFKKFTDQFDKPAVEKAIQDMLDEKMVQILDKLYWSDKEITKISENDQKWGAKLQQASAQLTRSGIGKSSVSLIVESLSSKLQEITSVDEWENHSTARQEVLKYASELLRQKFHVTVDQVENTIKPYKFEVNCNESEWKTAKIRAISVVENELRKTQENLMAIKKEIGRRRLRNSFQYLNYLEEMKKQQKDPLPCDLPPEILEKANDALAQKGKLSILQSRLAALRSSTCAVSSNRQICPEIFQSVVTEKLASTAVLFIYIELLNEFFFQLPRLVDNKLYYSLDHQSVRAFAEENPEIKKHLLVQDRKELLEEVMRKLRELDRYQ